MPIRLSAAVLFCFSALSASLALAQTPARWTEPVSEDQDIMLTSTLTRAIYAEDWLLAAQEADRYRADPSMAFAQWQAFVYAMTGRIDLIAQMTEADLIPRVATLCDDDGELLRRDALDTIVDAAAGARIVILQEIHWSPQQRVLLHELLPRLRKMGFTYLAAEDFQGEPEKYAAMTYSPGDAAFHSSREPVFADAIRRALTLGYRLVPYEMTEWPEGAAPNEAERHRADQQAQHLYDRIFANDPEAKAIIYAGAGHGRERVHPNYPLYIPMAVGVERRTGVDALTVDMTACRLDDSEWESGASIAFDANGAILAPPVLPGTFDLQVNYETESFTDGRPDWLARLGRKPVPVPEQLLHEQQPVVIEARLASEPGDASPFDRLYLGAGETLPLMLAPGEYRVSAQPMGAAPVMILVE